MALARGEEVTFRPKGNSMHPIVKNGQEVTLRPFDLKEDLKVGMVVLCQVGKRFYLHKILEKRRAPKLDIPVMTENGSESWPIYKYKIGNNKGGVNGWTSKIFGIKK